MRTGDTEPRGKETSRNLESPMSKLDEINKILEPTEWDKFLVKTVKKNLSQLLIDKKYHLFQEKIGMPYQLCDGFLGQKTLNYLLTYIIGVEDKTEDSFGETLRHIGHIFKLGRPEPQYGKEQIVIETSQIQPTKGATTEISKTNSNNTKNITTEPMFGSIPLSQIKSCPVITSDESKSYCCSKTARLNGLHFGIYLPRGNAYTAGITPATGNIDSLPKEKAQKKPSQTRNPLGEENFNSISNEANFADIYARSSTIYGHRAVAIRDSKGQWYLLDPYIKIDGKTRLTPIKLGDYVKKGRKIVKAHFYHSNGYIN